MIKKIIIIGVIMSNSVNAKSNLKEKSANFTLTSSDFRNNDTLAPLNSWKAGNKPPQLQWSHAPENTVTYTLIVDDPDAPGKTWVHWVVFNIPADATSLPKNLARKHSLPNGIRQGINDFKDIGYDGPYPPVGPAHRYFFKIYALDTTLNAPPGSTKTAIEKAMKGHVLASAQLIGMYQSREKKSLSKE